MNARIAENLAQIRERISRAAERSGRSGNEITLVAVTKYVSEEQARFLVGAGCLELGESRPQELWRKASRLADLPVHWHLVGHLQRNKVVRTLPLIHLLHSGDSRRIYEAADRCAREQSRQLGVLIEVNVSGEPSKHGFATGDIESLLRQLAGYENIEVRGLMGMASREGGLGSARAEFSRLRQLRDRLQPSCPDGVSLDELSMGMSRDFEIAIEEGATIVRVGSALFEGIEAAQ